jgi:hypothetical protein
LQRQTTIYPADKISLSMAADVYDIKTYANSAADLIGKNLN